MPSLRIRFFMSLFIAFCAYSTSIYAQKKEILLIGTFHFDNPGLDASKLKTLDIKSAPVQKEIDSIVATIAKFHPDKIMVEYPYQDQGKLDKIYSDYLADETLSGINDKSEIYQIGFKSGKALKLSKIDAIDYRMNLKGTDSVMKVMQTTHQEQLMKDIPNYIQAVSGNFNKLVNSGATITDILLAHNTEAFRKTDLGFYTSLLTKEGANDNFIGADVATQWYKRNIYMYALLQKIIEAKDQKVMIMLGASHIAALQSFLKLNPDYTVVEFKDILKK